jgi:hypothetical protein
MLKKIMMVVAMFVACNVSAGSDIDASQTVGKDKVCVVIGGERRCWKR